MSESGIGDVRGRSSYRGSGGGRGGRSKHINFNSNSSSYENKKEIKFAPYGHWQPQQVTYSAVKDIIVQNIQKIFLMDAK